MKSWVARQVRKTKATKSSLFYLFYKKMQTFCASKEMVSKLQVDESTFKQDTNVHSTRLLLMNKQNILYNTNEEAYTEIAARNMEV